MFHQEPETVFFEIGSHVLLIIHQSSTTNNMLYHCRPQYISTEIESAEVEDFLKNMRIEAFAYAVLTVNSTFLVSIYQ